MYKSKASPLRHKRSSDFAREFYNAESSREIHSQSTFDSTDKSLRSQTSMSAFGSVVGHDDPTAVMGNIQKSRSFDGSISLGSLATNHTDLREPSDDALRRSRLQKTPRLHSHDENVTSTMQDDFRDQLNELDRTEGQWQYREQLNELDRTANYYTQEAGDCQALPQKQAKSRSKSKQDLVYKGPSDGKEGQNQEKAKSLSGSDNDHSHLSLAVPSVGEKERNEIVRQVKKRLSESQLNATERNRQNISYDQEDPNYLKAVIGLKKEKSGHDLAGKTGLSLDEDDSNDKKGYRFTGLGRSQRLVLIILALFVLVGGVVVVVLSGNKGTNSKSVSSGGTTAPAQSPVHSPVQAPVQAPVHTPVQAPVQAPVQTPIHAPVQPPVQAPVTPTSSPVRVVDDPSSALGRLFFLSGVSINDPTTPQFAAYEWLKNDDPAKLNLDSLSDKELYQRYIAALFYFSMNGDDWDKPFGFLQHTSVCEWYDVAKKMGIMCSSDGSIEQLVINENSLGGRLPSELKELSTLKVLELRNNNVFGSIPSELGFLSMLEVFDLRENELQDSVPESIFNLSQLRLLYLQKNNRLSGSIPSSIELATSLEVISFQQCGLDGSLPTTMSKLSNLSFLTLMDNKLTGSIPADLTKLPLLQVIELSENLLTGTIPDFSGQSRLYFINLSSNSLKGKIPTSIGSLPGLLFLDLRKNFIEGSIPASIGQIPNLVTFFASSNLLTGSIPSFSGNKGKLQAINLSQNNLGGSMEAFFDEGAPISRLLTIDFSSNLLTSTIPVTVGNFHPLTDLLLKGNQIGGEIPSEIGLLSNLDTLSLAENQLTGTIPEEMGGMNELIYMDLGNNFLTGEIPDTLSLIPRLAVLDLASNLLTGEIPVVLSLSEYLDTLYLQNNTLNGDVDGIFCPSGNESSIIADFAVDCSLPNPEVVCSCCTECCDDETGVCEIMNNYSDNP